MYCINNQGKILKHISLDNYWLKIKDVEKELLNYNIAKVKKTFKLENYYKKIWIGDGISNEFKEIKKSFPIYDGLPTEKISVYVYINNKEVAKFYKGKNISFSNTNCLFKNLKNYDTIAEKIVFAKPPKKNSKIKILYFEENNKEDTGIFIFANFNENSVIKIDNIIVDNKCENIGISLIRVNDKYKIDLIIDGEKKISKEVNTNGNILKKIITQNVKSAMFSNIFNISLYYLFKN